MRILTAHDYYQQNGGENIIFDREQQFLEMQGHEILSYVRRNDEIKQYGVWQKAAFFPKALFSLETYNQVKALAKKHRPDIAIVQNTFPLISPSIFYALSSERIPIVQTLFNYRLICPEAQLFTQGHVCERCISGNFFHAILLKCYRDSYVLSALYAAILAIHRKLRTYHRLVDAFIVPDQTLKGKLVVGGFDPGKMYTNSHPFDLAAFQPSFVHENYLLFVGRLVPQKGVLTLLEAMRRIKTSMRLVVIGFGELESNVCDFIERNQIQNVQFLGPRWGTSLKEIMQKAYAVVVPSEWCDNTPLVILESFAIGKPVIASDLGGINEMVVHLENGLLFKPGDPDDLAAKIDLLANDASLQSALAFSARGQIEEMATSHLDHLDTILKSVITRYQLGEVPDQARQGN